MHNDLEKMYMDVINDNVNVSKTSDLKEFFILLGGLIAIVLFIIFVCNIFANIFITNMSDETQMKIERFLGSNNKDDVLDKKYSKPFNTLRKARKIIVYHDKELQNKSNFPIIVKDHEAVNAWITPTGNIYFTTALLNENLDDDELIFVLAHELGHYKHRDHLKSVSRNLIIALVCNVVFGQESKQMQKVVSKITNVEALSHSRNQERNADEYASYVSKKMFGNNNGGIKFMNRLLKSEKLPEFVFYFSTHPSTQERIRLLQK